MEEPQKYEYILLMRKPENEHDLQQIKIFRTDSEFGKSRIERYTADGKYIVVGKVTDCILDPAQLRASFNKDTVDELEILHDRMSLIWEIRNGNLDNYYADRNELEELRKQKRKMEMMNQYGQTAEVKN